MENVDFLPERIKDQRLRRRRLLRQGYLIAICVCALVFLGYIRQGRLEQAKAELALLDGRSMNIQRQLVTRAALEQQLQDLMVKKRIDERLGSRINVLDVMGELQRIIPESMALRELDIETMEVRLKVDRAGRTYSSRRASAGSGRIKATRVVNRIRMVITGIAPTDVDVANFIGQLSASPLFEDVNMGYAKNMVFRGRSAREFQASCYVTR